MNGPRCDERSTNSLRGVGRPEEYKQLAWDENDYSKEKRQREQEGLDPLPPRDFLPWRSETEERLHAPGPVTIERG